MPNHTAISLDFLSKLSTAELRTHWHEAFGTPLCFRLQKDLLIRFLAYRLQENALGSIKASTAKNLERIGRQFTAPGRKVTPVDVPTFKPGTRLLREWQGQTFEVTVLDTGFAYRGTRYQSLSKIAREITGARWSGPRFFGLKNVAQNVRLRKPHGQ